MSRYTWSVRITILTIVCIFVCEQLHLRSTTLIAMATSQTENCFMFWRWWLVPTWRMHSCNRSSTRPSSTPTLMATERFHLKNSAWYESYCLFLCQVNPLTHNFPVLPYEIILLDSADQCIYTVSQKTTTIFSVHNFAKCLSIFKILSPTDSAKKLQ